jgi:alpha-beta hydrolase superfamily lysophospholipase
VSRGLVSAAILQAPVSDREYIEDKTAPDVLKQSVAHASSLIEAGKGDELMPLHLTAAFPGVVISASRWHSLAAKGGYEDFFSSDLPVDELQSYFSPFADVPVHLFLGEKDEVVPESIGAQLLLKRFSTALSDPGLGITATVDLIPGANHELTGKDARDTYVNLVSNILNSGLKKSA